jgi:acetyl esterase/lipase
MERKYALAPEFADQKGFTLPANRFVLRLVDAGLRWQRRKFPWSDAVTVRTHRMPIAGGRTIDVLEVSPKGIAGAAPTIVDYHGGAFFLSTMRGHLDYAERYARETRCRVFLPEYRLSIDHPFPAGFDDAYATLEWVHANAATLGVDRERVVLLGDSAGGAFAAGATQRALDQRGPAIRAQILVYPVTDHESKTGSVRSFLDTPGWTGGSNLNMWKLYLRNTEFACSGGAVAPPPYAAPLHRKDFAGLPPAFVEVAEFDPLRDEGIAYARALEAAGVPVELHVVEGGIHGYDLVPSSPLAAKVLERRLAAIRRFVA